MFKRLMGKCILGVFLIAVCFMFSITSAFAATVNGSISDGFTDIPVPDSVSGNGNGVVLMYHHIVPDDVYATGIYAGNNAIIPISQFEDEMRYLYENGYTTLKMSEVNTYIRNGITLPQKTVVITFDDGYESNYMYAYPILQKYNLKANIAVVVISSLDAVSGSAESFDPVKQTHLSFEEMREMQASGLVEIGSHSYNGHAYIKTANSDFGKFFSQRKYLTNLGRSETYYEYFTRINDDLRLSKYILEKELGTVVSYFAFPYGSFCEDAIKALQYNGFEVATTVAAGKISAESNVFLLNRKNVNAGIDISQFAGLIN